jgi:antitoxin HigA-1
MLTRMPPFPGEFFRDHFRLKQQPPLTEADAAARLGWTVNELCLFEAGRRRVSNADAATLERVTGTSTAFWLKLQARVDQWIERNRKRVD